MTDDVTTGPCATCRTPIRRYGDGATTLCRCCDARLIRNRSKPHDCKTCNGEDK